MTNEKIARINELYKKSKAEGLSEEEKKERPLRGRDLWIWDDRSAQAIPAYTARDRRKLLPAANVAANACVSLRFKPVHRKEEPKAGPR